MTLTNAILATARPRDRRYKLYDERGLYLLVTPQGSKLWSFRYHFGDAERSLRFGPYPEVTLKEAREKRDDARHLLRNGTDPSVARKAAKVAQAATFELAGREYLGQTDLKPATLTKAYWLLEQLKPLHRVPIAELRSPELLTALKRIEADGRHETAHRANMLVGRILRYAAVTGRRAERDISEDIRGSLKPISSVSRAAITDPHEFGALLRAIDSYEGPVIVKHALKLAPLVFVRPGELRGAKWREFNFDKREWLIPGERMKMGRPHLVPLANQAIDLLLSLQLETGDNLLCFPGRPGRPISESAITAALRALLYTSEEMTWHGFRASASTLLNEQGVDPALIELQLAHAKKNKIAAVYDRSQRVGERREMMQAWSDYCDKLKNGV